MVTQAKQGLRFPTAYVAAPLSPIPKSFCAALADPNWRAAMEEESMPCSATTHGTLFLDRPTPISVSGKWIFKHNFNVDGTLERYKARWVIRGFTQRSGIHFDETFSLVVKPATVRTMLSLALSRQWLVH
jgi:hypothetical protein